MKDREEWARKQRDQYEERMRNIRARAEAERQEVRRRDKEAGEYRMMVERMLAELYRKNPDWVERKEKLRRVRFQASSSTCVILNALSHFFLMQSASSTAGDANTRPSPVSS